MAFHIRDNNMDMDILKKVSEISANMAKTNDAETQRIISKKIKELLANDEEELYEMMHPVTSPAQRSKHIQEMIMEGYTDQQMLQIHPEISQDDITTAKQELLNLNNAQTETQTPPEEL